MSEHPGRIELPQGRIVGVDYGRKRVGLAICDAHRIVSSPYGVYQRHGNTLADGEYFKNLVREEQIVGFVVGLPLHTDGSDSVMSIEVERFGTWLSTTTGVPVVFHDERFSSVEATDLLSFSGLSRGKRKARTDSLARRSCSRHGLNLSVVNKNILEPSTDDART